MTGTPRSLAEMEFAASLEPCPHCGTTRSANLDLQGAGRSWVLHGPCPSCGKARSVSFTTDGSPLGREHDRLELGGPEPSRIITPEQFAAELDRLLPATHSEPTTLDGAAWLEGTTLNDRAVMISRELLKFPAQVRYLGERDRLELRADRFRADAPRIWMLSHHRLTLGEEIRGLFNQVTAASVPSLAVFQAYLERRASSVGVANAEVIAQLDGESAVAAIRAYVDHGVTTVVLEPRSGTRSDIENAIGRSKPVVMGHALEIAIEYEGDTAKLVTIRFA